MKSTLFSLLLLLACTALAQSPSRQWRDSASGIDFVEIPAGCFDRSEPEAGPIDGGLLSQVPRDDEPPRQRVCVGAFLLGKYEVTRAQWQTVMGEPAPAAFDADPRHPVTLVSWAMAQSFIQRLNALPQGKGYRLPTEAEWEYACLAGSTEPARALEGEAHIAHIAALIPFARFDTPSVRNPLPSRVGEKLANPWGLHDMLGNVWEWTADGYRSDAYRNPVANNPVIVAEDGKRVIRGGSYRSSIRHVRCGARNFSWQEDRVPTVGLRLARDMQP